MPALQNDTHTHNVKAWFKVVTPREDLREGKPLDASEFAVHLDQVREKRAPKDYQEPERFFDRTYLTKTLLGFAGEVQRRLSGIKTETSAVFNMSTQFGGGKTHSLTLLYHLAKAGPRANRWNGVPQIVSAAQISGIPEADVAAFVGTEFDAISGRGGDDGTPLRRTPWGEIAWQLGTCVSEAEAKARFDIVAEHDKTLTAPSGEVIRKLLPKNRGCLILLDELMNYVSRSRKSGMATQLYNFLQNLSETARGEDRVVLAVSIPASELEMTAEDVSDYERFKKLLDRLGKPLVMSAEAETSEIIRRRLFEWDERAVNQDGKVQLNKDAIETCNEYSDWVVEHRQQLPSWFPIDNAREAFKATYPFHPLLISVFERKWQALPRFQQTRGVLRLLALWVSRAYQDGFKGAHRDTLISVGTGPLDDSLFRAAVFEQLGENRLEAAVTTDIAGKKDSNAVRLDKEAQDTIKSARLHQKVATAIFFESNGGQARADATLPEIRFAVGDPSLDIGNIETVLETLVDSCYYLIPEKNRYRFSLKENLNKRFADRRATIQSDKIEELVCGEIQKLFPKIAGVETVPFPEKSIQVPDRPALTLVVLAPEHGIGEKTTLPFIEALIRDYGSSARTFKSSLIFSVPDSAAAMNEDARRVLAWEAIDDESDELKLDATQVQQLAESLKKARRDLKEAIWRTYKNVLLLGKDNKLRQIDLGLIHSSAAESLPVLILERLRQDGDVEKGISPNFLVRNWPPAFKEWSTRAVRDAFFASPLFPRVLSADVVKETISRGVGNGTFAYVGKAADGSYSPLAFNRPLMTGEIEFSEDMFLVAREIADAYLKSKESPPPPAAAKSPVPVDGQPPKSPIPPVEKEPTTGGSGGKAEQLTFSKLGWSGEVPPQKWMNFYTKVLAKYASTKGLKVKISVEVGPEEGVSKTKAEETRAALRELGLSDDLDLRE